MVIEDMLGIIVALSVLVLSGVELYNVFIVIKHPQDNTLGYLKEGN
jgi:hypothetical protein